MVMAAGKPKVVKTPLSHPCSRSLSRTVRQRYTALAVGQLKGVDRSTVTIQWPNACPLHPVIDIFGLHEKNKNRTKPGPRNSDWVCNYTGKAFKSEHYLDLHMERFFAKHINENGTCLADYCDVFGFCNVKEPSLFESLASEAPACDPTVLAAQKAMCHSMNDLCTPPDAALWPGLNATKLNVELHKKLCEKLTCEARAESHFSTRKWTLFVGGGASLVGLCTLIYCMFTAEKQADRDAYASRRYAGAGKSPFNMKNRPGGVAGSSRPMPRPTKPTKQE